MDNSLKTYRYILIFLLITNIHCKAFTQTTLTMNQAVKMAYKYKPSLKALKFSTRASKYDEKKARMLFQATTEVDELKQVYFQVIRKSDIVKNQILF